MSTSPIQIYDVKQNIDIACSTVSTRNATFEEKSKLAVNSEKEAKCLSI